MAQQVKPAPMRQASCIRAVVQLPAALLPIYLHVNAPGKLVGGGPAIHMGDLDEALGSWLLASTWPIWGVNQPMDDLSVPLPL